MKIKATPTASKLAVRAEMQRVFDTLGDDAELDLHELALLEGRTEGAIRQDLYAGRCRYPAIKLGARIRFNVGTIRARRRQVAAEAIARDAARYGTAEAA